MHSVPGEGSEFSFELAFPRASDEAQGPRSEQNAAQPRGLIADDEPINGRVAEALARSLGHEAVTVDSGAAALERLDAERFDVLLLDLQMPDMDGGGAHGGRHGIRHPSRPCRE